MIIMIILTTVLLFGFVLPLLGALLGLLLLGLLLELRDGLLVGEGLGLLGLDLGLDLLPLPLGVLFFLLLQRRLLGLDRAGLLALGVDVLIEPVRLGEDALPQPSSIAFASARIVSFSSFTKSAQRWKLFQVSGATMLLWYMRCRLRSSWCTNTASVQSPRRAVCVCVCVFILFFGKGEGGVEG